jgi:hypothetical protein
MSFTFTILEEHAKEDICEYRSETNILSYFMTITCKIKEKHRELVSTYT